MNYKLKSITEQYLHISHSQVWAYLNCSLRYYFQYVLGRPRERTNINLIYGSALHKALERYYADLVAGKPAPGLPLLQELFTEYVTAETNAPDIPIVYKKDMADAAQTLDMGTRMLKTLYDQLPPPEDHIVSGVEVPLAARLIAPDGTPMDMVVTGILDLVLLDKAMNPVVVDFKTAKQAKSQAAADEDLQMTLYHYLMTENGYADPAAHLECRFHMFRKLKTPKLEVMTAYRNKDQTARLIKMLNAVLSGIENRVFIPNKGWLCGDCAFADACRDW
jgi:putative RecB family exonuclease